MTPARGPRRGAALFPPRAASRLSPPAGPAGRPLGRIEGGQVPLSSMTGFARAEGQHGDHSWTWEVKSVNGRGLDLRCRLPAGLEAVEMAARDMAGHRFRRGTLNAALHLDRAPGAARYKVNQALLAELTKIVAETGPELGAAPPRLDGLLGLRGVLEIDEPVEAPAERELREGAILETLHQAFDRLHRARREEGARLAEVVTGLIDHILRLTNQAARLAETQPAMLQARLTAAVAELTAAVPGLGEERLAQEVALLAAKADVREELDRLLSHVDAARKLLADGGEGGVGRRFDFLAQEFNREANTLCSKSQSSELTSLGLELKVAIDRLREQVQNIE